MKRVQQGFTLIELMIVVAIVGILAAVAIPAYRDYTIRSKVSEVAASMGACKTSVAEYHSARGSLPTSTTAAGCSTTQSQYLGGLAVGAGGVITATVSTRTGVATAFTMTLGPVTDAESNITAWTGASATGNEKYVPSTFR